MRHFSLKGSHTAHQLVVILCQLLHGSLGMSPRPYCFLCLGFRVKHHLNISLIYGLLNISSVYASLSGLD